MRVHITNEEEELGTEKEKEKKGDQMEERKINEVEEEENEKNTKKKDNEEDERRENGEKKTKSELVREKKKEAVSSSGRETPYPLVSSKKDKRYFACFLDIFQKFEITIPFGKALQQMSLYSKDPSTKV